ncbi:HlyC/CorC family transporter [Helicobacter sp. MIT 05-5293]|uniref:Membrane protein n=1 Tax=uncultured Helicobacter sp. TaxID=175537 RepID=A0A650ENE4_9HELI|nr:hemolysin family protein [Helicobacter sp. MIT 05-5293]QGT50384.1 membrane protein [uncultured Helicobacter sp.]TLD82192.1 HlyC/CorC family transporter [Helicobacter sp. MIT 05-5293]
MDPYSSVLMFILALALVFVNAFFVVSEFAIVKVRKTKLEELSKNGVKNANLALKISNALDTYLSATQLGITLASLALGWISENAVVQLIEYPFLHLFGQYPLLIHTIASIIAFIFITLLHVVLGELVPKSIAITKAEKVVLLIAKPLYAFRIIFSPLIKLFDSLAAFFLHLIHIEPAKESDLAHSEEELKIIVGESLRGGYIDSIEGEIIKNAVDFSDTLAKEIMTPRKDMICLDAQNQYEENIKIILETNHTRYPYYQDSKDNILGMIHIRDLFKNTINGGEKNLSKLVRNMIIVPETAHISQILDSMNRQQIHTALVVDEYGGTSGLLTMEDIIEEIMGDISDEHDLKIEDIRQIDKDTYEINGKLGLENIEEMFNITFSNTNDHVTIGGYVFGLLGRLPVVKDRISDENCEFEVLEMDGARIQKLRIITHQNKN